MSAQAFPSKYSGGKCAANGSCVHGGTIHKGQLIRWSRKQRGVVWHDECFKDRNDSDDIAVNNVVPISTSNLQENNHVSSVAVAVEPQANDLASTLAVALAPYLQSQLKGKVDEDTVISLVQSAMEPMQKRIDALTVPTRIEIINRETQEVKDMGVQHKQFAELLSYCQVRLPDGSRPNIALVGPAGSGKTTAVKHACAALGIDFSLDGAIDLEYKVFGYRSADGTYIDTAFRRAYEQGKGHLFDECDGSSPNALLAINAATANGIAPFPDKMVSRHSDHITFIAMNTWGLGASSDYVGRNKLDAASLDRYIYLNWETDESLEMATAGNPDWVKRVQEMRRRVASKGIKVLITPRASYFGSAMLAQGIPQASVELAVLRKGMTADQWAAVK